MTTVEHPWARLMKEVQEEDDVIGTPIAGELKLVGDCCVPQLDTIAASGLYMCRSYSFIATSDNPPQLTLAEIELETARMRMMIDLEDRLSSGVH